MATTTTTSKQFTLNLSDFWKGLFMAVIMPVLAIIMQSLDAGGLTFNWKVITGAAIAGLLGYLIKNFSTPAKIVVSGATPETVAAVKDGDIEVKVGGAVAKVSTPGV